VLKKAGRGSVAEGGGRLRDVLVASEIATALVLVIGAVLLMQTLIRLRAVDAGFRADGILTASINASGTKYADPASRQRFYGQVLERVAAMPGVKSVGLTSDLPYTSRGNTMGVLVEGHESDRGLGADALFRLVSADYLQTMSARLTQGRFLSARDRQDAPPVVVVNETFVRRFLPNDNPLGRRIDTGTGDGTPKWMTIVGVVRDVRERGLDLATKGAVYVPFTQTSIGFFRPSEIAILTSREPLSLAKELQAVVKSIDLERPVARIATMESIVDGELEDRSQVLRFLGVFAALALGLAALGVYSVLSYVVSRKTSEIGLRVALGATRRDILQNILLYAGRLTAVGLVLGIVAAIGATRFLASLLFDVSTLDPLTFGAVSVGLATVALVASWVPARRAAAVEPVSALREE
jgi:putative ABC transport system permease protein